MLCASQALHCKCCINIVLSAPCFQIHKFIDIIMFLYSYILLVSKSVS